MDSKPLPEIKPNPDPTTATNDAIKIATKSERDYVNGQIDKLVERFNAIDKATELLSDTVNRTPTEIQKQIGHLRELTNEHFASVDTRFAEVKEATQVALISQKESLGKAEINTKESLIKLENLFTAKADSLAGSLIDLSNQITGFLPRKEYDARHETLENRVSELNDRLNRTEGQSKGSEITMGRIYAAIAAVGAILGIIVLLANGVFGK